MNHHPHELLSAYADGELHGDEAQRVRQHLAACTECARELSIIRAMGGALQTLGTGRDDTPHAGVWTGVHRNITRPFGWVLLAGGVLLWTALAIYAWARQDFTWEWLAVSAMLVGLAMLMIGIAHEQYTEWRSSPYRDIER
jgi:anti-sigma factor RsiW